MFDPLDHPGIPAGHHGRHWHELDVGPIDVRATASSTLRRIGMAAAVETSAELFARQFANRVQDAGARRPVGSLGEAAGRRRQRLAGVRPSTHSAVGDAIDRERAAFAMTGWVAHNEREPDRSAAYRQQAWQHMKRLRGYVESGDRAHLPWAGEFADEVDRLSPPPSASPPPGRTRSTSPKQPLSLLHDWIVQAADRYATGYRTRSGLRGWEALVVQESAGCYLYYAFLTEEDDRRLRPVWELHLQMRLANLHTVSDLLRRSSGREPQEVIGEGLPEPVALRTDRPLAWSDNRDRREDTRQSRPGTGPDDEQDLLELLTAHHARTNRLFDSTARATGDDARMAFGDLVRLITAHEIAEERTIHPLIRLLRPEDHLAARITDEESRISDALSDAVRAAAHGRFGDSVDGLRDMVITHSRGEENDEFPALSRAVPVRERREMARAVHTAEAAAAAEAGPRDPAWAEPRALARTADCVHDALAGFS